MKWILALILSLGVCFSTPVAGALADSPQPPQTCEVGIYVTALRNFKLPDKTFDAEFRLWSICPTETLKPLKSIKIIGAINPKISYETFLAKKNISDSFLSLDQLYYHQQEINATIAYSWNVDNYPFDRHVLKIQLEDEGQDISKFIYTPDLDTSGYQKDMSLGDWKIINFKLEELQVPYPTNFGDPSTDKKRQARSRLVVSINVHRQKALSFFKLVAGVYAAIAVTTLSFFLESAVPPLFSGRMSLLVGLLFAIVVNMRVVESAIGRTESITLADFIHIVATGYVFVAALFAVYSRFQSEAGHGRFARRMDRHVFFPLFLISFIVVNVVAIAYAALV